MDLTLVWDSSSCIAWAGANSSLTVLQGAWGKWTQVIYPSHTLKMFMPISGTAGSGKLLGNKVWKPSLSCLKL